MSEIILYSYFRSSASWRVRIALAMKSIKYEYKAIHLVKDGGQQHAPEYATLNPMEQVPCLMIDGVSLTESLPIIEYLEETRRDQGPSLYPSDPAQRAKARALAEVVNSGTQAIQNLCVLQKIGSLGHDKAAWAKYWINRGLTGYERIACKTAGKFSVGDQISVADLCLIPQIYNANRFEVDMTAFPTINRINEACRELDVFKAAHPCAQPDCPEELR